MKYILLSALVISISVSTMAQTKLPAVDKSSMDMSYYPANYPILKIQDKANEPLIARVIYSRPQKNGRSVFGELVEYGKIWRLGANEATELEFYKDVLVAGKPVAKGRYTLYAIPENDKWIFIINKETDIWGAFKYDSKKDVLRVDMPVQRTSEPVEVFSMMFDKAANGFVLIAAWDNLQIAVPITPNDKPAGKVPAKTPIKKTR